MYVCMYVCMIYTCLSSEIILFALVMIFRPNCHSSLSKTTCFDRKTYEYLLNMVLRYVCLVYSELLREDRSCCTHLLLLPRLEVIS